MVGWRLGMGWLYGASVVLTLLSWAVLFRIVRSHSRRVAAHDANTSVRTELLGVLQGAFLAAKASLAPCPSCDVHLAQEQCLCGIRRRSLQDSVKAVETFVTAHRPVSSEEVVDE